MCVSLPPWQPEVPFTPSQARLCTSCQSVLWVEGLCLCSSDLLHICINIYTYICTYIYICIRRRYYTYKGLCSIQTYQNVSGLFEVWNSIAFLTVRGKDICNDCGPCSNLIGRRPLHIYPNILHSPPAQGAGCYLLVEAPNSDGVLHGSGNQRPCCSKQNSFFL